MAVTIQRPLKGSRISSFYPVKSLPPLSSLDSAFQLQEYISLLIRLDVHDVDRIVSTPGKSNGDSPDGSDAKAEDKEADKDSVGGVNVDEACWVYEQLRCVPRVSHYVPRSTECLFRRLAQDLSHPLITMLQQECTRSTCPEMKAGEWLYLCVAHGNEGAMEVSLSFWMESSAADRHIAAMLCYRLHLTYARQCDCAPQLSASIPFKVSSRVPALLKQSLTI